MRRRYDVVVVGGGHNALVAAAYLARAGRSVLVLERSGHVGGAAVSEAPFAGVDARLSRYSYLVSLLPRAIVDELGLRFETRRRRISSYTPVPGTGPRRAGRHGRRRAHARVARAGHGGDAFDAWQAFYDRAARVARAVFPTMLEPLVEPRRAARAGSATTRPGRRCSSGRSARRSRRRSPTTCCAGSSLTDALIGTFAGAHEPSLRQNRCFLYHVIGNGTGAWDVPVGGMGALTDELAALRGERRRGARDRRRGDGDRGRRRSAPRCASRARRRGR